jgi:hypothetical protein
MSKQPYMLHVKRGLPAYRQLTLSNNHPARDYALKPQDNR